MYVYNVNLIKKYLFYFIRLMLLIKKVIRPKLTNRK